MKWFKCPICYENLNYRTVILNCNVNPDRCSITPENFESDFDDLYTPTKKIRAVFEFVLESIICPFCRSRIVEYEKGKMLAFTTNPFFISTDKNVIRRSIERSIEIELKSYEEEGKEFKTCEEEKAEYLGAVGERK